MSEATAIRGGVHRKIAHDSAQKHVAGAAAYVDDLPAPEGLLHACIGWADRAHARLTKLDLDAVRAAPGVEAVFTAADIPGENDVSPTHLHDEPLLATDRILFHGQPLFVVAARTRMEARRAARLARIEAEDLPPVLDYETARNRGDLVCSPMTLARGDADAAIARAPRRLSGRIAIGGQDHFYLEGQIAMAIPGEDEEMLILSSTQHPSEIQAMVAAVLACPRSKVTVECRRMGGGFGGKETQGNLFACLAALVARRTGRTCKLRPDRDDDMIITGKRHDFEVDYEVGFDEEGRLRGTRMVYASRCGWSADLSGAVTDRALFHADNAYFHPDIRLVSRPLRTNMASATAFRGFGGPQGMVAGERLIEEIAFATGEDPLTIRKRNLYGGPGRDETPYGQVVDDGLLPRVIERLEETSDYWNRRAALRRLNAASPIIRHGLALTPVKFGISFTRTAFNQAGALIHIYQDGSIHLNHGGTEMGQGLYVKVAQVVAEEFQVDIDRIHITATTTAKVPNTSATAASSGADLNGMAARDAARTIRRRLVEFAASRWDVPQDQVRFLPEGVQVGNRIVPFEELVQEAYLGRVSLSSTGFYKTPKIHWDREAGKGRPFFYYAYGAACTEVAVDTLTGEHRVLRVDILHDVGSSLNPAIDRGQVEGGFVQGMGWLTCEELWWDGAGRLRTHAPSTYKIPVAGDVPEIFNVELMHGTRNREATIHGSKAVGEPPLMLAISVLHAISDAVASLAGHRICPRLDPPATPERVLDAIERVTASARTN